MSVRCIAYTAVVTLYRTLYRAHGRAGCCIMLCSQRQRGSRHAPATERLEPDARLLPAARRKRRLVHKLLAVSLALISMTANKCICVGLRACDVEPRSQAAFQELCQVTTGDWGELSAEALFKLCRETRTDNEVAVAAFKDIFHASGVCEAADVFMDAASSHATFGQLACKDKAKAMTLIGPAQSVSKHFGSLYHGKSECLRSSP